MHSAFDRPPDSETVDWVAFDGLVVIPKDALITEGTVI
jgi:hypothetical protein